ncbi:MAG: alpha/beta hydrolase family protein, partial [Myxococcota bacterium]
MTVHWMDRLYGRLFFKRHSYFESGWGDNTRLEPPPELFERHMPEPIDLHWGPALPYKRGVTLRRGWFESPWAEHLPVEARLARVRWLEPERVDGEKPGPVCVFLASWADSGHRLRERIVLPLVRQGTSMILLENPYYGQRCPVGQDGTKLRHVSDLIAMWVATWCEGRGLLRWLRDEGYQAGVAGYSMGAQVGAMVGVSIPWPVAIVPLVSATSPVWPFTEGILGQLPAWDVLGERSMLGERLKPFSLLSLPGPYEPDCAVLVGARRDGILIPEEMRQLADHWNIELRWLNAGHISAFVWHGRALRSALSDAFQRLASTEA